MDSLNILCSFAYLKNKTFVSRIQEKASQKTIKLMIDSGAFSSFTLNGKIKHVTIDNYITFCKAMEQYCCKYVTLDVVGDETKTKANYERMLKEGLNPMYVVTMFDNDFDYINYAVSNNPDICVAGGVTTKGDWMKKRFQDVYYKTNRKARIHGLGYVIYPDMVRLPLVSVDCSSWKGSRFGDGKYFNNTGFHSFDYNRVFLGQTINKDFGIFLDKIGVSKSTYYKKEHHRGGNSIEVYANIISYLTMSSLIKRKYDLDFFFAIGNTADLERLLFISSNIKTITYDNFYNEFKKTK